jgi:predicted aldo/keto reductase-like oxidoreductase
MRYRPFGQTGWDISRVSMGCMRFPDEETAVATVRRCVEKGINYFETANGYGESEIRLGKAFKELGKDVREKVMLSSKSRPSTADDRTAGDWADELLNQSLERMQVDYLDFYHIWSINNEEQYDLCLNDGWMDVVQKAKDAGKVRHIGITSHAPPALVERIIDEGLFEVLMVQYSLILQSYRGVIAKAHDAGMGVVLMGPLAGGLLTRPSPILPKVFAPDDQVAGALKYVLCDPGVSSAASGMTSPDDVDRNCAVVDSLPDDLDISYQDAINEKLGAALGAKLDEFEKLLCGGCRYCAGVCPEDINPSGVFKQYNATMLGAEVDNRDKLAESAGKLREKCVLCGKCLDVCPQKIDIPEHLERVQEFFSTS